PCLRPELVAPEPGGIPAQPGAERARFAGFGGRADLAGALLLHGARQDPELESRALSGFVAGPSRPPVEPLARKLAGAAAGGRGRVPGGGDHGVEWTAEHSRDVALADQHCPEERVLAPADRPEDGPARTQLAGTTGHCQTPAIAERLGRRRGSRSEQ